jgi:nicotinate-nucleotide pyrophosphorylase (carboxylating)
MSLEVREALSTIGLPEEAVLPVLRTALAEDLGRDHRDVTSEATIPADRLDTGELRARAGGVIAGLPVAAAVFDLVSKGSSLLEARVAEGSEVAEGALLAVVTGRTRALLAAERTALNLLSRLSGVATLTRRWVEAVSEFPVTVLDTRKTTPGLRLLEKYAVRAGGGTNKRLGLYDVAMVKDNHKRAAGGVGLAVEAVRRAFPELSLQVEVTTLAEAEEAVAAGAHFLLCDNMAPALLREVVEAIPETVELEATGGLALDRAHEFAATGVDFLSIGALTHSAPIVDIALDLVVRPGKEP